MKRIVSKIKLYFAIIILAAMIFPPGAVFAEGDNHKPITRELINLVEKNPEIRNMLEKSIAEAKKNNPDRETNPVQSLPEYYNYLDTASELIPGYVLKSPANLTSDRMLQEYLYFFFLVDQPLPELKDKGLFKNALQYYEPFTSWMRNFAGTWGAFLNTEKSWNNDFFRQFYGDPRFGLQKEWYESPSRWKTFNQFFSRHLKSPDMRPVASPDDPAVVVLPADSVPQGVWPIDENSNIKVKGGIKVKLETLYNVKALFGNDSQYKDAFANGMLTHSYLGVTDYHRYHFAVGGTIKETRIIEQNTTHVVVWDKKQGKYLPIDFAVSTGWQFSQTRGYVIVDTGEYGLVALIPIGMGNVSSVNFESGVKVGTTHKKGDLLGYFLFGGSDFIILFQEKAGFELTPPAGKHLLMGEKYGIMKRQTK